MSTDLQVKVDHVVLVQEGDSLQDLPHQPLHIPLAEGLVLPIGHTLVEDLTSSRTARAHTHKETENISLQCEHR